MQLQEFLTQRYNEYYHIIRQALDGIAEDPTDPEYLHRARTYARRIQTMLKSFPDCFLEEFLVEARALFKELLDQTSEARDLDVFLAQEYGRLLPPLFVELYAPFEKEVRKRRESRYRTLARRFGSKRFRHRLDAVAVPEFVQKPCAEAKERIEEALLALERKPPAKDLHKLRIRYKRKRYLTELLGYFKDVSKRLKKLKKITDRLGRYHDLQVHVELILALASARIPRQTLLAAGKVAGDLEEERLRLYAKLSKRFKKELQSDKSTIAAGQNALQLGKTP